MKTPTVEQLQAWTQQWDEAKRFYSIQKVLDLQQAEAHDPQAKNLQKAKAQVTGIVAGEQIVTLKDELGSALEDLGLEPPWSARNSKSGLYRTDDHVIPLAIRMLDGLRLSKASRYADFAESDHQYGYKSPFAYSHLAVNKSLEEEIRKHPKHADELYQKALAKRVEINEYLDELASRLSNAYDGFVATPDEEKGRARNAIHVIVTAELMARTEGDTLASIDENMTEKTTDLIRLIVDRYFPWRGEYSVDWSRSQSYRQNIERKAEATLTFEQVFKQFNQEKNAERHLSDCFDVAYLRCATWCKRQ